MQEAGRSPNTCRSYGAKVAAYLTWSADQGFHWRFPTFTVMSRWKMHVADSCFVVAGEERRRSDGTRAIWETSVFDFYKWAAAAGLVDAGVVGTFFELRTVPARYSGEGTVTRVVPKAELRTRHTAAPAPKWLETEESRSRLLEVDLNPRDKFLVILLFVSALRIGQALALFREDVHLVGSARDLGCDIAGPHVHLVTRETLNDARNKSREEQAVPIAAWAADFYADYQHERHLRLGDDDNPHVFVNLYVNPGEAMRYSTARELFERISRVLEQRVRAHMLRHTRATAWLKGLDCEPVDIDVVRELLGHASVQTTGIYLHSDKDAMRAAVDKTAAVVRGERP